MVYAGRGLLIAANLAQIEERDRRHGAAQVLEPIAEGVPLLDGKVAVGGVGPESLDPTTWTLRITNGKAPVSLGRPVSKASVGGDRHFLA